MKSNYQTPIMSFRSSLGLSLTSAFLTIFLTTSCALVDALNATPTPIIPTGTPVPSPTIDWFPASATPTPGALPAQMLSTPEMRPGLGPTTLTDNFADPFLWNTATSDHASAEINNNRLNLSADNKMYIFSLRQDLVANDFYAEITARVGLCRGDDSFGMLVRANGSSYYQFSLSCNGTVYADRVSVNTHQVLQTPIPSSDVPTGAPGEARIGVWAVGPEMRLFLNGRYQFSVSNTNYPSGTIGVFVSPAGETPIIVSFSRLTIQEVDYTAPTSTPQPIVTKGKPTPKP